MGSEFYISYHRYEAMPQTEFSDAWATKVKFKAIGTVYDSEKDYSPAAKRLEDNLSYVWDDGLTEWSTIEELMLKVSEENEAVPTFSKKQASKPRESESPASALLPMAELSTFMFATKPGW